MKVLLINSNRERMPWPVMPIGLCMVATAAAAAGHVVKVLDLTLRRQPDADVKRELRATRPHAIGISIRNIDNCNFESPTFYLQAIRAELIPLLRRNAPDATIVIGGSAVNIAPQLVLDYVGADCALSGEGEVSLPQLLSALEGTAPLPAGIHFPENGRTSPALRALIARSPAASSMTGSGFARAPALPTTSETWRWTDWRSYAHLGATYPLQTKRGCALRCSYCVYNDLEGRAYRLRSPESIIAEIEEARAQGVDRFEFVDSTFNIPKRHSLAVCEAISRRRLDVKLSTMGLNPRNVDDELVDAMLRAGFDNVMCSAESASNRVLESMAKGYTAKHVARTAAALRAGGLPTYWFFLLGAPGETMETVTETLDFCAEHIPQHHVVLFATGLRILPGTPLERECRGSGWLDAADRLLEPTWYVSPHLNLPRLGQLLAKRSNAHPNWMVNGETALSPRKAAAMKAGFRMLGWGGPFWQHLPRVFSIAARMKARDRGIQSAWRKVLRVTDVVHHR